MTADDSLIARLTQEVADARSRVPATRAALIAISGIDGCGKGYVSSRLLAELRARGLRVELIGIDGWLNLPARRFSEGNPAEHFYLHGLRLDEMFSKLVLPLRKNRSLRLEADLVEETATAYHKYVYEFSDVDIILLEGIYLLKRAYAHHHDFSIWLDCTFETALERAIARGQEALSRDETIKAYGTIYFPAQQIHFERDDPKSAASLVVPNDPRLIL